MGACGVLAWPSFRLPWPLAAAAALINLPIREGSVTRAAVAA